MANKAKIVRENKKLRFKVRYRNRCSVCGRPHGYMRFFGLCRLCFRDLAHRGLLPGVRQSSW
ncbi:type Z 30S ribosomal protein S14 [Candidatus Shapirobacteria bacterium]|nr:MAG: type Z 30S ribosomal protein S14 [Candidatus Shapirobacteria bacterium]